MNDSIKALARLFAENVGATRGTFFSRSVQTKQLAALLYAVKARPYDAAAIEESYQSICASTGAFSMFRHNTALITAAMLSLADDPKQLLKGALSTYDALKAAGFRSSDYLAVAAFCIAEGTPQEGRAETVKRAKAFYDGMRRQHFFLTGREDYIYAAMLGMSGTEVDSGAERLERIYQALKHDYMLGNKVQALSQVLVLSEDETQSIERFRALRGALAAKRLRMDQEFTLSSLGVLSLLPVKIDQIADEVEEVYTYLKAQRGLGAWSTMKQQRLLLAAAVVAFARLEDQSGVVAAALTTAIISIIIAQQVAIIAASSSAAASASN